MPKEVLYSSTRGDKWSIKASEAILRGLAPDGGLYVPNFIPHLEKTLRDIDDVPNIILFSPFEIGLTIQSTFSFLAARTIRAREIYFPIDSMTIYDRADVVITAQPSLIENCPEGKCVIKINKPYNKEIETKYSFNSLMDVINDKDETLIKIMDHKIEI